MRPRPTSPDATNTKYMASPALAPSPKQTSEKLGFERVWKHFETHVGRSNVLWGPSVPID